MPHRQIEALLGQVREPIAEIELQADLRVAREQRRNRGCDVLPSQRDRRCHAHEPARRPGEVFHPGDAALDVRERGARLIDQLLAGGGQRDRACGAADQRDADRALEVLQAHADRGLGDTEAACGLREAAGLSDHGEHVEIRQRRLEVMAAHRDFAPGLFKLLNIVIVLRWFSTAAGAPTLSQRPYWTLTMATAPFPLSAAPHAALVSHWIGGQPVSADAARSQEVFNPATGKVARHVTMADAAMVDRAVSSAARRGRPGPIRPRSAARACSAGFSS